MGVGCSVFVQRSLLKPVVASTAYLLISHGSRDPRPQEAMERLAELVRSRLADTCALFQTTEAAIAAPESLEIASIDSHRVYTQTASQAANTRTSVIEKPRKAQTSHRQPEVIVGTACLELAKLPLSEQIAEFANPLAEQGIRELKLLPVFLMSGVHVMEDIPQEVAAGQQLLGNTIRLTLCPHLGSHPEITDVLAKRLASVPAEGSLLVAHGSRRPKGNRIINALARELNTAVAYWATPPDIETQVIELMQQGCQKLAILPYFLFAGGITDAITHRTEELAERFPKIQFRLLPTLGATHEVAHLAYELIHAR